MAVIIFILAFIFNIIIANEFSNIAIEKGSNTTKYFWYSLFFGFVGYLMVIALPDKNARHNEHYTPAQPATNNVEIKNDYELPDL